MAIFSLNHASIGRQSQARPHTAAAHVRYITRPEAMSRLEGSRMPVQPGAAQRYLRAQEDQDRANARVADKVRLALPRELDAEQRAALVRAFAEDITQGKASWLAAFHDLGKDAHNPHCHLVIRDRDPETGRRVIGMSEAGSTRMLRERWEHHTNIALEAAGRPERVDRRSLKEQGVTRAPTIHEGPKGRAAVARGRRPVSRAINVRNGPKARSRGRVVNYHDIDRGRSRTAYNAQLAREAEYWAAIDADAAARARELERRHVPPAPAPTVRPIPTLTVKRTVPTATVRPVLSGDTTRSFPGSAPSASTPPPAAPSPASSAQDIEARNARRREELRRQREEAREQERRDREARRARDTSRPAGRFPRRSYGIDDDFDDR